MNFPDIFLRKTKLLFWGFVFCFVLLSNPRNASAQYMHAQGKEIVDGNGQPVLLRGIGFGGWMLQEGYMMKTSDFANTQHELRRKIEELIGPLLGEQFYTAWRENYCQKTDIDSLKAWGFNSIRLPLHYNLFTLPIEEEPVAGQQTWLDTGFELTDRLLDWCEANQIYLILDLHAAPGGQGQDQPISDYDPSKPSLWEDTANQEKTVALWRKIAERYVNEPWIGGYDLINEVNWQMSGNIPLKNLYVQITKAIRAVDKNHIIFIEGNWFANDFTGLTPPWDNNMVYSFHKYWSVNDQASIQWMLDMRTTHNIPIWCGESGENSNVWFTNAIKLFEKNNIGWAWWPYKKIDSMSGIASVTNNAGYQSLLNYWSGSGSQPSVSIARDALMQLAENLKLTNCKINRDVIDAMFRQVTTKETKPFIRQTLPGTIFATNYDLGSNGFAYFDRDTANFQVTTGSWTGWNSGWAYRNDGVDIETCSDVSKTNGYNIGWIEDGEWLQFTTEIVQTGTYSFKFRVANGGTAGLIQLALDGRIISRTITIPNTGGWDTWKDVAVEGIPLENGVHKLQVHFTKAGCNLNYFEATFSGQPVEFGILDAKTSNDGAHVFATVSKKLALPLGSTSGFTIQANGLQLVKFSQVELDDSGYVLQFHLATAVRAGDTITISYVGESILSADGEKLPNFFEFPVQNQMPVGHFIPGKIEAEDFDVNNGFQLEATQDAGGGQNLGWADQGDFVEYNISVSTTGNYSFRYRFAAPSSGGMLIAETLKEEVTTILHAVAFSATGGWQNWQSIDKEAQLPAGDYALRLRVLSAGFNLNWFETSLLSTSVEEGGTDSNVGLKFHLNQNYPNPFNPATNIEFTLPESGFVSLKIYNVRGEYIETLVAGNMDEGEHNLIWYASGLPSGTYFCQLQAGALRESKKLLLMR
ncbi:MAG: carbohydrate-binding protein [Deferribacteres bacterium]|nr:carbohydrate-binding protein [Deferribacteres bacterium]